MSVGSLGFHHAALQVRDVNRVAAFYTGVLGLIEVQRFLRDDGSLRSVWCSVKGEELTNGFIAIEAMGEGDRRGEGELPGFSMVALRIEAAARPDIVAGLAARAVPIVKETKWTVYVRDPEGNLIGLSHHPTDPPKESAGEA